MGHTGKHSLRILHISDLHARGARDGKRAWRRTRVLGEAWQRNLDELTADGRAFDIIVFTGDIADWGLAEEYRAATPFIHALCERLKIPRDRLFIVPGNHDIHRKTNRDAWQQLRHLTATKPHLVSEWLAGSEQFPDSEHEALVEQVLERQRSFWQWIEQELGRSALLPRRSAHGRIGYRVRAPLEHLPFAVHVIGLDSAWISGGDNEAGHLWLTEDQVGLLCSADGAQLPGFRLALVHHPLAELADGHHAMGDLADYTDLLLRGHQHTTITRSQVTPDREFRELAAGCLYEGARGNQHPNACHVIDAVLDDHGRSLHYDVRFRSWSPDGRYWYDDGAIYREAKAGRLRWNVRANAAGTQAVTPRVFISYKHNAAPDESVVQAVDNALRQRYRVFIDKDMQVGVDWMQRIDEELRQADVFLVFLSAHSVASEMVLLEVEKAHRLATSTGSRLRILPVRIDYRAPFEYPLSAYLGSLHWASWNDDYDTDRLIADIERAIDIGESSEPKSSIGERFAETVSATDHPYPIAQPMATARSRTSSADQVPLDVPDEGTMGPTSQFYIERPTDAAALSTIARGGVTITIKGPRQMGKSSLLIRVVDAARTAGRSTALMDFQLLEQSTLETAEVFFRQFCVWLSYELEIDDGTAKYWNNPLGNSQRCTRYVARHLLPALKHNSGGKGAAVLALDEVERIFDAPFRNDFFAMLRAWHNQRAINPLFRQLDLVLVTSTEPYQLVADLNQSPFNVGTTLELHDFSTDELRILNQRYGDPMDASELDKLMALLHGQPYLSRRALHLVANGSLDTAALFASASDNTGPFGDHLRYHLFRLYDQPDLVTSLLRVIREQHCPNERMYFRLHGAGLIRREADRVVPRCQVYADFFREHLDG